MKKWHFYLGAAVGMLVAHIFGSVPSCALNDTHVCCIPVPADFVAYKQSMKERFYRNLPSEIFIPKTTTVRFFLTESGFIRDISMLKSSGSRSIDLACMDAVLSASPLPPPPPLRQPLPPPPYSSLLPPDSFGSGIYTYTFAKTSRSDGLKKKPFVYRYLQIPKEVLSRYPGLFSQSELDMDSNELVVTMTPEKLETIRFQWAQFYKSNEHPSKEDIVERARLIRMQYIEKTDGSRAPRAPKLKLHNGEF